MNPSSLATEYRPLTSEQASRLDGAATGLSTQQLVWASGYLAGLAAAAHKTAGTAPTAGERPRLTILYGSQTGNGRTIATRLEELARSRAINVLKVSMAEYPIARLKRESHLLCIVSTHGEGDPPDDAHSLFRSLQKRRTPRLESLRYSVLALGDSSYSKFCEAGRQLDRRLEELGAIRMTDRVECDVDFDRPAAAWINAIVDDVEQRFQLESAGATAGGSLPALRVVEPQPRHSREFPFDAELLVNQRITGRGSINDVRHIELSLEGSGLEFEPGDALGVVPTNPPKLIDQIIDLLNLDPAESVIVDHADLPLWEALNRHLEITTSSRSFVEQYARSTHSKDLDRLLLPDNRVELAEFLKTRQIVDVIRDFPAQIQAAEFTASLRTLTPRLYSVASCLEEFPDEVHLTVDVVRYERFGHLHWGAASTHLGDRVTEGETLSVFIENNPRFHLPTTDDEPILMIGNGTGVAPYRGFLQQRSARGASGRSWLVFGHRHFDTDFLYQIEWQRHLAAGTLTRLDVAFSRDQQHKVYVQHKLVEHGRDVYAWLDDGAHVYVCGDASHMAPEVHSALIEIVQKHGGLSQERAQRTIDELLAAGRYHRDVYQGE
ncbi:MAG: assimilatory sulfite reductase (NADPH) flavoprotein subunit [bacterium]|nr:assimilatory sulfite reductase (NADPH) flavoprotein subunit [bacterium]